MVPDGPNILKFQGVEDLTQLNISLRSFLRKIEGKGKGLRRCVLDIVSDALLTHDTNVVRRWLMDLLTMFKYTKVTTLSTLDPGMHSKDEARTIIDIFDGHMEIAEKKVDDEQKKTLNIKRLYRKKYLERELILDREKLR
jgi:hypothetical protein